MEEHIRKNIAHSAGVTDMRWKEKRSFVFMIIFKVHQTSEIKKNAGDKPKLTVSAVSKDNNFSSMHPMVLKIVSF